MPGAMGAEFRDVCDCRQALHQSAISTLRRTEFRLGPIAFHRDGGQMSGVSNQLQMLVIRRARLAIVDRERSQDAAALRSDRRRPTGSQIMRQSKVAKVRPQGVARNIGNDDLLSPVSRSAAGSYARTDLQSING